MNDSLGTSVSTTPKPAVDMNTWFTGLLARAKELRQDSMALRNTAFVKTNALVGECPQAPTISAPSGSECWCGELEQLLCLVSDDIKTAYSDIARL